MSNYVDAMNGKHSDGSEQEFQNTTIKHCHKIKVGDYVETKNIEELESLYEYNSNKELVFSTMDLSDDYLEILKEECVFEVKEVDEDGDLKFTGISLTFPKECVNRIMSSDEVEGFLNIYKDQQFVFLQIEVCAREIEYISSVRLSFNKNQETDKGIEDYMVCFFGNKEDTENNDGEYSYGDISWSLWSSEKISYREYQKLAALGI